MPDKTKLQFIVGRQPQDLKAVRLPGLDKPFEKLTISELVQLRPGSDVADSYDVNAVTDNISVSTSSVLEELGRIQKVRTIQRVVDQARLNDIRNTVTPVLGGVSVLGPSSAQPPSGGVALGRPEDDVLAVRDDDPFKA